VGCGRATALSTVLQRKKRKTDTRVSEVTKSAHAAMTAKGQAQTESPRPGGGLSIKSVKETCREELDLYLSMCHDLTIDDVTPTGAGMDSASIYSAHYDLCLQTDLWQTQLCWLSRK